MLPDLSSPILVSSPGLQARLYTSSSWPRILDSGHHLLQVLPRLLLILHLLLLLGSSPQIYTVR